MKEAAFSNKADLYEEVHPPLTAAQAVAEADRCLFCYDAPCLTACPTSIDVPKFIRKISSGNPGGAARTILESNILGGTCARACPTEILCEEACVLNHKHEDPVAIGQLQRFAVDHSILDCDSRYPFARQESTGYHVAVVGGGPAGLACAHRLSMLGHDVTIFDRNSLLGGLNEYGLAAYKMVDDFAQREVDFILRIGGIHVRTDTEVGSDAQLDSLIGEFDAVFVAVGLAATRRIGIPGEDLDGVEDAIAFIRRVREQGTDSDSLSMSKVVVIGGGNTAIDAAVQAKRLGAAQVDLLYRRGPSQMSATKWEQDLAATEGVFVHHRVRPAAFVGNGRVTSVVATQTAKGRSTEVGSIEYPADRVLCAIGQIPNLRSLGALSKNNKKLDVSDNFETGISGVFAGGDCISRDDDLTVHAVEHGKLAAHSIHNFLMGNHHG